MKQILLGIFAFIISLNLSAQNNDNNSRGLGNLYCAKFKDGIVVVVHEGSAITSSIVLDNGMTLKIDGTLVLKDGTRTMLKDGDCINQDGTIPAREK